MSTITLSPPRKAVTYSNLEDPENRVRKRKRTVDDDSATSILPRNVTPIRVNTPQPSPVDIMNAIKEMREDFGLKLAVRDSPTPLSSIESVARRNTGGEQIINPLLILKPPIPTLKDGATNNTEKRFQDIMDKMGRVDLLNRHTRAARAKYDDLFKRATQVAERLGTNQTMRVGRKHYASIAGLEDFKSLDDFEEIKAEVDEAEELEADARLELSNAMLSYQQLIQKGQMPEQ